MIAPGEPGAPPELEGGEKFSHKGKLIEIRDVWADNLEEEMAAIREKVLQYPVLAMDTEFPGCVARPVGSFSSHTDFHYQTLRCNVDLLRIIQLGLTLADEDGNVVEDLPVWQFNFSFNLAEDMYAEDSISLLERSGIRFEEHAKRGIDVLEFGELLTSSGLVLTDEVKWVSFHSGYDFGYLLKVLTCSALPAEEGEFFKLLKLFFPKIYDVKQMMIACEPLIGGLNKVAEALDVIRCGPMHQAGSDSLLTLDVFFAMVKAFFGGKLDEEKYCGVLYGLGSASS